MKNASQLPSVLVFLWVFFFFVPSCFFYREYRACGVVYNVLAFIFKFYLPHMWHQIFGIFKCVDIDDAAVIVSVKMMEWMNHSQASGMFASH